MGKGERKEKEKEEEKESGFLSNAVNTNLKSYYIT